MVSTVVNVPRLHRCWRSNVFPEKAPVRLSLHPLSIEAPCPSLKCRPPETSEERIDVPDIETVQPYIRRLTCSSGSTTNLGLLLTRNFASIVSFNWTILVCRFRPAAITTDRRPDIDYFDWKDREIDRIAGKELPLLSTKRRKEHTWKGDRMVVRIIWEMKSDGVDGFGE